MVSLGGCGLLCFDDCWAKNNLKAADQAVASPSHGVRQAGVPCHGPRLDVLLHVRARAVKTDGLVFDG